MAGITETKNRLPNEFVNNLYEMFTPGMVDNIFRGIAEKRLTTLRVNTLKYDIQSLMKYFKEINIKFERVLWYNDALIIKNANEKDIQKLEIYQKGHIYLQSLSSMVPPLVLNPKEGENVLDLTAAPGSKTTQIASLMNGKGHILANELDKLRCERRNFCNDDLRRGTHTLWRNLKRLPEYTISDSKQKRRAAISKASEKGIQEADKVLYCGRVRRQDKATALSRYFLWIKAGGWTVVQKPERQLVLQERVANQSLGKRLCRLLTSSTGFLCVCSAVRQQEGHRRRTECKILDARQRTRV